MTEIYVDQTSKRPTRKVVGGISGAVVGTAVGAIAADLATTVANLSVWLSWLSLPDVQLPIMMLGAGLGSGVYGWLVRDKAKVD